MMGVLLFLESLGGGELLVIMLFILIFFGSSKIPDLARGLGKGMREVRDAMQGVQSEINQTIKDTENSVMNPPANSEPRKKLVEPEEESKPAE